MKCRICGEVINTIPLYFHEMMFGTGKGFNYYHCENCNCLQIDKTESPYQDFLWDFRECCQSPNLDRRFGLSARCYHEEAAQD